MNNQRRKGPQFVSAEKPKNFKLAIIKLFKSIKNYRALILVSLVLAMMGSIMALIAPNKLSDLVDEISSGLVINRENIEIISMDVADSLSQENIAKNIENIIEFNLDEETSKAILESDTISDIDKFKYNEVIMNISKLENKEQIVFYISSLPDSVLDKIFTSSTYNQVEISSKDKIDFIKLLSKEFNEESIKDIPDNILLAMLNDSKIANKKISREDKLAFVKAMIGINKTASVNELYEGIDKLPINIKSIIEPKIDMDTIRNISIFLIVIYLLSSLFSYVEYFIMTIVSNRYARNLRTSISKKINRLPLKYFDDNATGDVLSRITNDVDMISHSLSQSLDSIVSGISLFVGAIIMMFITNWIMAITAIASSIIGFALMAIIMKRSQKYFFQRQESLGNLNGHIEEIYSGLTVVKAYNGKNDSNVKFDKLNKEVYESSRKSQFFSGLMQPIMIFIGNFGYVAVVIVGALLVFNDAISFGIIVAFIVYVRLFTQPMARIAQAMTMLQGAASASERVFDFLEEKEMEIEDNKTTELKKSRLKGMIEFENVSFGYSKGKNVIKNFSAIAKPGQKIAIVGPTGAGKTTIVNLLMKFYDINKGDIKIDGVSINELTRKNIHSLFTMVLQDTWLFNGTIKENILYNHDNIDDKSLEKICETVGIDHFIRTLPKGYESEISDNDSVSAGQRQLLTIARGMVKDAPLLILDEATSNVDTRTEELVQKAMDKITEGRTSFIIAHRLSTIKNADLILVMKDGNIVEQGNHKDLLNKRGFYFELYNSQFSKEGIDY